MAGRGPAGSVIRQVAEGDVEAAFVERTEERIGGKGSTDGIRVGSKDAMGTVDPLAARNMAQRAARRKGQQGPPSPAKGQPAARVEPVQLDIEDWERETEPAAPTPVEKPAATARIPAPPSQEQDGDDMLSRAEKRAWALLKAIPDGMELYAGAGHMGPEAVEIVMGLGVLVGKGFVAYRGSAHYRLSEKGRQHVTRT